MTKPINLNKVSRSQYDYRRRELFMQTVVELRNNVFENRTTEAMNRVCEQAGQGDKDAQKTLCDAGERLRILRQNVLERGLPLDDWDKAVDRCLLEEPEYAD